MQAALACLAVAFAPAGPAAWRVEVGCRSGACARGARAVRMEVMTPSKAAGNDLKVLEYPHPLLRAENAPIEVFDDELAKLAKDMLAIMYASRGVGLAAPQIGVNRQLMVFNPDGDPKRWTSEVSTRVRHSPQQAARHHSRAPPGPRRPSFATRRSPSLAAPPRTWRVASLSPASPQTLSAPSG